MLTRNYFVSAELVTRAGSFKRFSGTFSVKSWRNRADFKLANDHVIKEFMNDGHDEADTNTISIISFSRI